MCGRFSLFQVSEFLSRWDVELAEEVKPRYNIAPTQRVPVVLGKGSGVMAHWGITPSWQGSGGKSYQLINTRVETLAERPGTWNSLGLTRCLVPADGFYEWEKSGKVRQPYRITLKEGGVFAFAGVCNKGNEGSTDVAFSILTCPANEVVAPIHDRMPVILGKREEREWISTPSVSDALRFARPYPAEGMRAYKVSTRVNDVRDDDPDIISPV